MKNTTKQVIVNMLIMILSISMYQCKSPSAPAATTTDTTVVSADTVATAKDTTKTAIAPAVDTVVKQVPLTLVVNNLSSETAPITIGVYGTENKFPDPKDQLKEYKFTPNGKQLTAKITDLKFGTYALAIYQDVNSNGKIDKNLIGIPTEPYAFSNNYKPKVKAPNFDNCKFEYDSKSNTVTMNLLK